MGKRTRSDSLMRKPYEYIAKEDRLQMPHGISIPRTGGGNKAFVVLRQYARQQPTARERALLRQDYNRATVEIVRGNPVSNNRVAIRLRNRIKSLIRRTHPDRDWSDDVLMGALATVESAGTN